jgi:DNA-directed RNA polymerase specialized sigma24 family protein
MSIETLKAIKKEHKLSSKMVAKLIGVSVHTVNSWLCPATSKCSRTMPAPMLELLTLKLRK